MFSNLSPLVRSAIVRAARTFAQTFLATLGISAAGVVGISTAKAALVSAVAAGLAAAWRGILDPSPVPSLPDPASGS